ncbi:MAG: hypothetical protein HYS17_03470 [Micavibrio aeruginosavorus]|uniref:Uncharacterized protein n=1 Tax=Micavibrio aeruginosavorus TaxID=349221 RepID=A0A7T5UH20_9BACT|nr:MAG: hypothetical protein HYS17_03470 [Micavibrio aeruginosavorus]
MASHDFSQNSLHQKVIEVVVKAFADKDVEARELNALYHAILHGHCVKQVFENGLYLYQSKEQGKQSEKYFQFVDSIPVPVASNPMVALNEVDQNFIQISLSQNPDDELWCAHCDLGNGAYFGTAYHADRDQALSRAIMIAVISALAEYLEKEND